jgi:hypothetical protein
MSVDLYVVSLDMLDCAFLGIITVKTISWRYTIQAYKRAYAAPTQRNQVQFVVLCIPVQIGKLLVESISGWLPRKLDTTPLLHRCVQRTITHRQKFFEDMM